MACAVGSFQSTHSSHNWIPDYEKNANELKHLHKRRDFYLRLYFWPLLEQLKTLSFCGNRESSLLAWICQCSSHATLTALPKESIKDFDERNPNHVCERLKSYCWSWLQLKAREGLQTRPEGRKKNSCELILTFLFVVHNFAYITINAYL